MATVILLGRQVSPQVSVAIAGKAGSLNVSTGLNEPLVLLEASTSMVGRVTALLERLLRELSDVADLTESSRSVPKSDLLMALAWVIP